MRKQYVQAKIEILSFNTDAINMSGAPVYYFIDNIASDLFDL